MKHIVKIMALLVAISAFWFGLLQMSIVPSSHTWLVSLLWLVYIHAYFLLLVCFDDVENFSFSSQLPIYFVISLGCYGLLMVGVGLMQFPTCPQEALLLQQVV